MNGYATTKSSLLLSSSSPPLRPPSTIARSFLATNVLHFSYYIGINKQPCSALINGAVRPGGRTKKKEQRSNRVVLYLLLSERNERGRGQQ